MMRFPKPLLIGLAAAYFIYLVLASAPATLVSWAAVKAVPGLSMGGVTGTIWSGRAAGASIVVDSAPVSLGALSWHLSPLKLLLLQACVKVTNDKVSGDFCRGVTGASTLKSAQVELPANIFNGFVREYEAAVDGNVSLLIEQAKFTKTLEVSALKGNLTWRDAKVNANQMAFALGDYGAELNPDGAGGIKAQVVDISGHIKVNLEAIIKSGQPPRVAGKIHPSDQAPAAIRDVLGLVATQADDGSFQVVYPAGG